MKKTIILLSTVLLSASLYFTSCKKVEVPNDSPTATTLPEGGRGTAAPAGFSEDPTGIAEITEEHFNHLMNRGNLLVKKAAPHRYIGVGPYEPPVEPFDPCAQDWIDFQNWWNANIAWMQAWANAHCQPFRYCWSGQCVSIMFFVNPTKWCGDPVKYEKYQKVFEQ